MPTSDTARRGSALSTCHRGQLLVNYYTKKCDMLLNDNELKTTIYRIKLNGATRHKSREAQFVISRLRVRFLLPAPKKDADSLRIGVLFICYMLCVAFGSSVLCGKCFPRTTAVKIAGIEKPRPAFTHPPDQRAGCIPPGHCFSPACSLRSGPAPPPRPPPCGIRSW